VPAPDPVDPFRLAVFASGGGSNFQSMIDAVEDGTLDAEIVLCVSNHEAAGALDRAADYGIPTTIVDPDPIEAQAFSRRLLEVLDDHDVTFIALAGYLRKIPPAVVEAYRHRMLNIHPALLPAFGGKGMYGMNVHRAVVDYGVHWTGATVHVVDEEYDHGPIVLQQPVPVYHDDTPDDVARRVLAVEHAIYPRALRLFSAGRVQVDGRSVRILDAPPDAEPTS